MYPIHTNPLPSTSTFTPRPTSIFEPILPQQITTPSKNQNSESSPQSLLPCGQRTPTSSTNTSNTPSQDTPPQPHTPTQMHHTSPKPHKPQNIHGVLVKTNVNTPTQPSIPDEEAQRVPKSTNGN